MSRYTGLIQAFDKLAEASATVALELQALETPEAGAPLSAPVSAVRGSGEAPAAATIDYCPKHGKAFTPSKNPEWPAYCSEKTDEPAWGKSKTDRDGNPVMYCRITSRNAGEWLAIHGRAA